MCLATRSGWRRLPLRLLVYGRVLRCLDARGGVAIREEGVAGDLGNLPAGGVRVRAERPIGVPADDASSGHALYILVEGRVRGHIGEGLPRDGLGKAGGIAHDLGD